MSIEEYAALQNLPDITKHEINGKTVYQLENSHDKGKAIGLPFFVFPDGDSFRRADCDETMKILDVLFVDDEEIDLIS